MGANCQKVSAELGEDIFQCINGTLEQNKDEFQFIHDEENISEINTNQNSEIYQINSDLMGHNLYKATQLQEKIESHPHFGACFNGSDYDDFNYMRNELGKCKSCFEGINSIEKEIIEEKNMYQNKKNELNNIKDVNQKEYENIKSKYNNEEEINRKNYIIFSINFFFIIIFTFNIFIFFLINIFDIIQFIFFILIHILFFNNFFFNRIYTFKTRFTFT